MRLLLVFITFFSLFLAATGSVDQVSIRSAADLVTALEEGGHDGAEFDFEATVVHPGYRREATMAVADDTSAVNVLAAWGLRHQIGLRAGDRVHVKGYLSHDANGETSANCRLLKRLGTNTVTSLPLADPVRLNAGAYGHQPVRIRGRVRNAERDELDPTFNLVTINCGKSFVYCFVYYEEGDEERLARLVDAEIEVLGFCHSIPAGWRKSIRKYVQPCGLSAFSVLRIPSSDPAAWPDIKTLSSFSPEDLVWKERHSVRGTVLAVWHRRRLMIRTSAGTISGIELQNDPSPACGDNIIAGGFPDTNLYCINLTRAIWRPDTEQPPKVTGDEIATNVTAAALLTDKDGRTMVKVGFHGRLIRLTGTVRDLPGRGEAQDRIVLDCDGFPIDVHAPPDFNAFSSLEPGVILTATGICLIRTHNESTFDPLPRADGFQLILRTPADLSVLARPPWWTPTRLLFALAILFFALLAVLFWNVSLRRLVDRRSRALLKEQIARIGADLRVDERTRLAVELHDSLSQTLTGVSLQLDAVRRNPNADPEKAKRRLDLAAETLHACRDELKDCIFDLRNLALDEPDFAAAVKRTLAPCLGDATLAVRFDVARARLSDATAHAVLRIVREFAANAVRHGHASRLRVAGDLTDGTLSFSVRDNGCGFDPSAVQGPTDGHFGLQGVRERVKRLNGTLTISSARGGGTKAVVVLHLRSNEEESGNG